MFLLQFITKIVFLSKSMEMFLPRINHSQLLFTTSRKVFFFRGIYGSRGGRKTLGNKKRGTWKRILFSISLDHLENVFPEIIQKEGKEVTDKSNLWLRADSRCSSKKFRISSLSYLSFLAKFEESRPFNPKLDKSGRSGGREAAERITIGKKHKNKFVNETEWVRVGCDTCGMIVMNNKKRAMI